MQYLLNTFFSAYNKFYKYDLDYSLLWGREYELVYEIMKVFNDSLLSKRTSDADSKEGVDLLKELVDDYANKIDVIFEKKKNIKNLEIDFTLYVSGYKNFIELFDAFVLSYTKLSDFTQCDYHVAMLIKFHNYMSHLISNLQAKGKKNLERGISHLYRGALDGYKEIIRLNKEILLVNKKLSDDFFKLREEELLYLGKKSSSKKLEILKGYDDLTNNIMTLANIT